MRRGALHLMAPVAVAPPPLRFSFQPLAGHKVRLGCGAQSPARKKPRIGCGAQSLARKKAIIDKGALRLVSKKARPELQGSLLHARGVAAQTQPLARPFAFLCIVIFKFLSLVWGSSNTSFKLLIGPQGTFDNSNK